MIYLERVFHSVVFCLILTRPLLWQSVIYLSLLWWITQQAQLVWELFQTLEQMTDLDSFEGLRAFHSHVMSGLYKQSAEELTAEPLGSYIHAQNPPNHQLLPKSDQVGTWTQNFLLPLCGPELQVYLPIHSFFLTFSFSPLLIFFCLHFLSNTRLDSPDRQQGRRIEISHFLAKLASFVCWTAEINH